MSGWIYAAMQQNTNVTKPSKKDAKSPKNVFIEGCLYNSTGILVLNGRN